MTTIDRDLIAQELRRILSEGQNISNLGGSSQSQLAQVDPTFVNEFVDDGSVAFMSARVKVIENLAKKLFGDDALASNRFDSMASVPKSLILKTMKALAKQRQLVINEELRKVKEAQPILSKVKAAKKVKDLSADYKEVMKDKTKYNSIMYPDLADYKDYDTGATFPKKQMPADVSTLAASIKGSGKRGRPKKTK